MGYNLQFENENIDIAGGGVNSQTIFATAMKAGISKYYKTFCLKLETILCYAPP